MTSTTESKQRWEQPKVSHSLAVGKIWIWEEWPQGVPHERPPAPDARIHARRASCVRDNLFRSSCGLDRNRWGSVVRFWSIRRGGSKQEIWRHVVACRDGRRRPGHEDNSFDRPTSLAGGKHPSMNLPTYLSPIAHVPCHILPPFHYIYKMF
jgi:hypothetical protein